MCKMGNDRVPCKVSKPGMSFRECYRTCTASSEEGFACVSSVVCRLDQAGPCERIDCSYTCGGWPVLKLSHEFLMDAVLLL